MDYPYRECELCGTQLHTGGVYQCRECRDRGGPPETQLDRIEKLLTAILDKMGGK